MRKRRILNSLDVQGKMISEEALIKHLDSVGIVCQSNRATIVYGKAAAVVGVLLRYLGHRSVAVVLESTEGFVSAKKNRGSGYAKSGEIEAGNSSRNMPFVDPEKTAKPKHQPVEEQSRCICSCLIF